MRIVLISDELSPDVAEAVHFARAHGVEEIAIRGVAGHNVAGLDAPAVEELVARVTGLGVRVRSVLSPLFKAYQPGRSGPPLVDPSVPEFPTDLAAHLEARERLPVLAARLGADCIRVFAFLRERGTEERLSKESWRLLSSLEQSHPGLYALENEDSCTVGSIEELESCVAETGLRAVLDPGNDWFLRRAPIAPRIGARLVGRLADVHVKDMAGDTSVPLGDGELDWAGILTRLRELGYSGTLTLEPHLAGDANGVARSIAALQKLIVATA